MIQVKRGIVPKIAVYLIVVQRPERAGLTGVCGFARLASLSGMLVAGVHPAASTGGPAMRARFGRIIRCELGFTYLYRDLAKNLICVFFFMITRFRFSCYGGRQVLLRIPLVTKARDAARSVDFALVERSK